VVSAGWTLSLAVADPFFSVYMVSQLKLDVWTFGLLVSFSTLCGVIAYRVLGRVNDRRGEAWTLTIVGLLMPLARLAWLLVRSAVHIVPVYLYWGFMLAGYSLTFLNMQFLRTTTSGVGLFCQSVGLCRWVVRLDAALLGLRGASQDA